MQYTIQRPSQTAETVIALPASKSISNRALILHALAQGVRKPENLSNCDDTHVMIKAFDPTCVVKQAVPAVAGTAEEVEVVDIMAAGTAMRFLTAYLSVTPGTRLITGTPRMQQRPIKILVDALRSLGADITYVNQEGYPPLLIKGKALSGHELSLPGHVSSQYISALLMIGADLPQGLTLHLTGEIISRPYINMTLQLMQAYGVQAAWTAPDCITVPPGTYADVPFRVESDWSAASYWYEIMALSHLPEIELTGLQPHSTQGDSRGAELFARLGINTTFTPQGVKLSRGGEVTDRLDEDLVDIPDLAQTFVVTCCLLGVPFHFTGLQSLKIKETDRITALIAELAKLGYVVKQANDSELMWNGERCAPLSEAVIATYDDHRMAMAFAPACLALPKHEIRIDAPMVVTKSYPQYWEHLQQAGFQINTIH